MKKITILLLLATFVFTAYSQKKYTLDNVNEVYLRSTGSIIENGQTKGYFFMYVSDKIDRKTNQYILEILDQNLNKVKEIPFEDSKDIILLEGSYNTNSLAFLFKNDKKKTFDTRIYNIDGNLLAEYSRNYDRRTQYDMEFEGYSTKDNSTNKKLFAIGSKGYVGIYPIVHNKTKNFEIDFYLFKDKSVWSYIPEDEDLSTKATILGVTDSLVFIRVTKAKNNIFMSENFKHKQVSQIDIFNIYTKKVVGSFKNDDDKILFYPEEMIIKQGKPEIEVAGYYYDKEMSDGINKGFAIYSIYSTGKVRGKKFNVWENDLAKYLPLEGKGQFSGLGSLLFEKVICTNDGKIFLIGEGVQLKQKSNVLLTDMAIIEMDKNINIANATVFKKTHNRTFGDFDYEFSTNDFEKSNFNVLFKDYLQKDGKENLAYSNISYNDGKFAASKINLNSKADVMKVFPAKAGSIMIFEYFKKEKRIDIRLEKLG